VKAGGTWFVQRERKREVQDDLTFAVLMRKLGAARPALGVRQGGNEENGTLTRSRNNAVGHASLTPKKKKLRRNSLLESGKAPTFASGGKDLSRIPAFRADDRLNHLENLS